MNSLSKLLVYLKQPEDVKSSLYPIYIRITLDGKRAEISTKRDCDPGKWNKKAGRMIGTTEKARKLNLSGARPQPSAAYITKFSA